MRDVIMETDLGRDPDDFFAVCYLSLTTNLRALIVSPGDPDQLALARILLKRLNLDIPLGAAKEGRNRSSVSGWHRDWVRRQSSLVEDTPDAIGPSLISTTLASYPEASLFVCAPPLATSKFLDGWSQTPPVDLTMQGGFVPYSFSELLGFQVSHRLEKFEGLEKVSTFNLGGDKKGSKRLVRHGSLRRRFVGKNVCHTITYGPEEHERFKKLSREDIAFEVWMEGMTLHLEKRPSKAMHDPVAAVCHVHPEIGTWTIGSMGYDKGTWGAEFAGEDQLLVDLDREKLWFHLESGT